MRSVRNARSTPDGDELNQVLADEQVGPSWPVTGAPVMGIADT